MKRKLILVVSVASILFNSGRINLINRYGEAYSDEPMSELQETCVDLTGMGIKSPLPSIEVEVNDDEGTISYNIDRTSFVDLEQAIQSHLDNISSYISTMDSDLSTYALIRSNLTRVNDVSSFPVNNVVRIWMEYYDEKTGALEKVGWGSGFLIGEDTVVTAGHNIRYSKDNFPFRAPDSIYVFQEYRSGNSEFHLFRNVALVDKVKTHPNWWSGEDLDTDIAVLKITKEYYPTGGFLQIEDAKDGQRITAYGYPGDIPNSSFKALNANMYTSSGFIDKLTSHQVQSYECETQDGMSGGAILNSSSNAVGVISGRNIDGMYRSTRLNEQKIAFVTNVRDKLDTVHRLYNKNSGEHIFTTDWDEVVYLNMIAGWKFELTAFYGASTGNAVYRLYNPNGGIHHYTTDAKERDALIKAGWKYESIAWYAPSKSNEPIYRLYNPNSKEGLHHYTKDIKERDYLINVGWKYEGIAWYSSTL